MYCKLGICACNCFLVELLFWICTVLWQAFIVVIFVSVLLIRRLSERTAAPTCACALVHPRGIVCMRHWAPLLLTLPRNVSTIRCYQFWGVVVLSLSLQCIHVPVVPLLVGSRPPLTRSKHVPVGRQIWCPRGRPDSNVSRSIDYSIRWPHILPALVLLSPSREHKPVTAL